MVRDSTSPLPVLISESVHISAQIILHSPKTEFRNEGEGARDSLFQFAEMVYRTHKCFFLVPSKEPTNS